MTIDKAQLKALAMSLIALNAQVSEFENGNELDCAVDAAMAKAASHD